LPFFKYIEDVLSKNPLIVVGSGTSCGAGISGMSALSNYLVDNISIEGFQEVELQQWKVFKEAIQNGFGLEQALQNLGDISTNMTNSIVHTTWQCILNDERAPIFKILNGEDSIGFVRLFRWFQNSNVDRINIITTNYDHLIEASAAIADWEVWDGFGNGVLSKPIESSIFNKRMKTLIGFHQKKSPIYENIKHIKIFKLHGSLSWFKKEDNSFVKMAGISTDYLGLLSESSISPVIVTPGIGKYLETHYEPYTNVMSEMKESIRINKAMLFLGFGFNDVHIQASFQSALRDSSIPKLIITRSLTDSFNQMRDEGNIINYFAIEQFESSSRVISDQLPQDYIHQDVDSWSLKGLLNNIWGEE
jgi:hypothetical protein